MEASQAQLNFIGTLVAEREYTQPVNVDTLTKSEASNLISELLSLPKRDAVKTVVPVGFYILDETVYRVVESKSSGNLYAKCLDTHSGRWEYAPGAIKNLVDAPKLTVEVAARMGARYGICMVCGRTLTAEDSVEAGIGPVCSGRL
jgi:hypothetical protein